jgi:aspartate/methionine/tyrosine aminotransferase
MTPKRPLSSSARAIRESIFSRLAGRLARHGEDAVPLHLGDTIVQPPPGLVLDANDTALFRYGAPAGESSLLGAVVAALRAERGLDWVEVHDVQITVGGTAALAATARVLLEPGDEVLVPTPSWPLIRGILTNAGAVPVEVPLSQRLYADGALDPAAVLAAAVTPRTAAIYLTTPNNPDGKVLSRAQLEAIGALAAAHDLWVIGDEAYRDFLYDGKSHVPIASIPSLAGRTVTALSFSKSYALAGWRLGVVVGPRGRRDVSAAIRKVANHTVYNVPDVLQRAVARVVGTADGDESPRAAWLADTRRRYDEARRLAASLCPVPHHLPEGATYLFADFSSAARDGEDSIWPLVEELLDEGVSISPGEQFGAGFERHARLCFTAVPPDRLKIGLLRIRRVLERRRAG